MYAVVVFYFSSRDKIRTNHKRWKILHMRFFCKVQLCIFRRFLKSHYNGFPQIHVPKPSLSSNSTTTSVVSFLCFGVPIIFFGIWKNNTSQKLVWRFTIAYIKLKKIVSFASYFPQIHLGAEGTRIAAHLAFWGNTILKYSTKPGFWDTKVFLIDVKNNIHNTKRNVYQSPKSL